MSVQRGVSPLVNNLILDYSRRYTNRDRTTFLLINGRDESYHKTMVDELFSQLAIFEGMDASQRSMLKKYFVMCQCNGEEVIFAQGDPAAYLFIVIEGEVVIEFKPDDGPALVVGRIGEGGVFGWSAAFGRGFYTSAAICTQSAKFLRVRGVDLKMLRENHPETGILILERLAAVVAQRLENVGSHSQVVAFLEDGMKNGIKPIGG